MTAADWIDRLGLKRHPEGGYYRETYRSTELIPQRALPKRFPGARRCSTAIYYLLTSDRCSMLHRIRSDEVWHFYTGNAVTVHVLTHDGHYTPQCLGPDPSKGQVFQYTVQAGAWFGATVDQFDGYALMGCTVAPGFDFADFEVAHRGDLLVCFPEHRAMIERLTRSPE